MRLVASFLHPFSIRFAFRLNANTIARKRNANGTLTLFWPLLYMCVKNGSHASEVLITCVSLVCHSCAICVSHASINYVASELYCIPLSPLHFLPLSSLPLSITLLLTSLHLSRSLSLPLSISLFLTLYLSPPSHHYPISLLLTSLHLSSLRTCTCTCVHL